MQRLRRYGFCVRPAHFNKEFLEYEPNLKIILTVRDVDDWSHSIQNHFNKRGVDNTIWCRICGALSWLGLEYDICSKMHRERLIKIAIRTRVYKGLEPDETNFKTAYLTHNQEVVESVSRENLLVLDINDEMKWEKICEFVGVQQPDAPFPHSNKAI